MRNLAHNALPVLVVEDDADLREAIVDTLNLAGFSTLEARDGQSALACLKQELVGLVLSVGVAIVQFWPDYWMIGAVIVVFLVGQFLEGNVLQPRLVGKSVGLHPVWLMFALFAFGALFGFVGLLISVPAAAAVAVLVRFAIARYLESPLYKGHDPEPPPPLQSRRARARKAG